MQQFVGLIVFIMVCVIAAKISVGKTRKSHMPNLVAFPAYFAGTVVSAYVGVGLIFGFVWVFAEFGIYLRYGIQWFAVSVMYPWRWI